MAGMRRIFNTLGQFTPGGFALSQFQKVNKSISATERVALESGTVGYEASIFKGTPDWKGLMATPAPELSEDEQSFLDNEVETLCAMVDDWKVRSETKDLPAEAYDYLKKNKFFGMIIPKEYGGLGFSAQAHSAVVAKIASRSGTAAATTMVPNSLGPAELLHNYGTKEQKDHYLPRLADGREIPCFSLTSPKAGSDATSMEDEGVLFRDKDGEIKIRLNWEKRYITLAPIATLFGLAFKLKDPDHLLGDKEDIGITLALVPAETPGISRDFRHQPMGMPFLNGPHWGKDVVIPAGNIIGGPAMAGKGWSMLVDCLSVGRSISLPASSSGVAHIGARTAGAYSAVRQQFGMPLSKMEGVQESLARIGGLTYMIDAARVLPLQDLDLAHEAGKVARPAVASAILKYHTTEAARQIAIDSMDVHAGKAVMEGPDNPAAAAYQGVPVAITVEGANILTRNLMIFGQSAFLAHPYTLKEVGLAQKSEQPGANLGQLRREARNLLVKHIANIFNNAARSVVMGLTGGRLSAKAHNGADARFYQQINRLSSSFGFISNVTMLTLQSDLKRKQRTSALLADGYSNLYMASQVLRRWNLEGRQKADEPLMKWAATHCLHKAEQALFEAIENSDDNIQIQVKAIPVIGKMGLVTKMAKLADNLGAFRLPLKAVVFPLGRLHRKPSHELDRKVAEIVSTPGAARERLTAGMYIPKNEKDYIARLERAFELTHKSLPHEQALAKLAKENDKFKNVGLQKILNRLPRALESVAAEQPDAYIGAIASVVTKDQTFGGSFPSLAEQLKKDAQSGALASARDYRDTARQFLRGVAEQEVAGKSGDAVTAMDAALNRMQDNLDRAMTQAGYEQRRALIGAVKETLVDASKKRLLNRDAIAPVLTALEKAAVEGRAGQPQDVVRLAGKYLAREMAARTLQGEGFTAMAREAQGKGLISKDIAELVSAADAARKDIVHTDSFAYTAPAHHRAPAP